MGTRVYVMHAYTSRHVRLIPRDYPLIDAATPRYNPSILILGYRRCKKLFYADRANFHVNGN